MNVIYEPKGEAREYAGLALNIYNGCTHTCKYCYAPESLFKTKSDYFGSADPKKNLVARLTRDCMKLSLCENVPPIHLTFTGDAYQPAETELRLTRQAIKVLIEHDLPFTILTKGGMRAARDFDLLEGYDKCSFGTTLLFWDQDNADKWELDSPSIRNRVSAIQEARRRGIKTWVSLEPVIDPDDALQVIESLHPIVDHWKIGKINHVPWAEDRVDWTAFRREARELLDELGAGYYFKNSLTSPGPGWAKRINQP